MEVLSKYTNETYFQFLCGHTCFLRGNLWNLSPCKNTIGCIIKSLYTYRGNEGIYNNNNFDLKIISRLVNKLSVVQ